MLRGQPIIAASGGRPRRRRAVHVRGVLALTCCLGLTTAAGAQPGLSPKAKAAARAAATARSAPVSEWDDALNAFKYQDFDRAIPRLRKLIYPKPRVEQSREWRAREYLAASLWWSGKKQQALDEFTALLVRNPPARLDPAYYPPQMIKDFERLRANLIRLGVIKKGQKPTRPKPRLEGRPPALALAFFPLGVGQFANREPVKGAMFLGSQAGLAGASIGLYLHNRDLGQKGQRSQNARIWQVTTGGLFWAVAAWGVIDAVVKRGGIVAALRRQANSKGR